jgi:hypothetical protein
MTNKARHNPQPAQAKSMTNTLPQDSTEAQDLKELAKTLFPVVLEQIKNEVPNMDEFAQKQVAQFAANSRAKSILATQPPKKPRSLEESVAALGARIAAREATEKQAKAPEPTPTLKEAPSQKPAEVIQLNFWGEDYRAAPNAVFRSALFPATNPRQKEKRPFLKNDDIYCVAGIKIFFTGEQFDQTDLDVYLEILNMAQPFPLGTPVTFSAHALLKALGLHTGGKEHTWLHGVLIRLCGGVVDATDHGKRYFGQLLHGGIRDEITQNYTIKINPDFAVLFGFGMFSKIDLATRRALGRNNTAKALQAYYSTHLTPGFHNIETLCHLTGLRGINRKRDILKAHAALVAVGFCEGYELNEDGTGIRLVNMSQHTSQARAIVKKAAKATKTGTSRRTAPTLAGDLLPLLTPKK